MCALISFSNIQDNTTVDAADVNTPLNTIFNDYNGNIDDNNIKAGAGIQGSKIADTSVTGSKLNLSKTTDANGWTVYNYGTFKKYMKASAQTTLNISANDRTRFTTINLPVGIATAAAVHIHATMTGSTYPGDFFLGLETISSSTDIGGFIGNNYGGGTLATGAFIINVELTDI